MRFAATETASRRHPDRLRSIENVGRRRKQAIRPTADTASSVTRSKIVSTGSMGSCALSHQLAGLWVIGLSVRCARYAVGKHDKLRRLVMCQAFAHRSDERL